MKKNYLLILVMILIGLSSLVSAKMTPYSPDGYNQNVEVYIEKGWNMILMPSLDMHENNFKSDSDVKKDDIKAIYVYLPQKNNFYEAYPNSEDLMNAYSTLSQDAQGFLNIASAWVYSDKSGYLKYSRVDVRKYDQVALVTGWNFFTLTPELKMKKLSQFKGDCEILKIAHWQHQEWTVIDQQSLLESSHSDTPSRWDDLMLADSDSDIGMGTLIKVKDSCQFGSSSSISPPSIPN